MTKLEARATRLPGGNYRVEVQVDNSCMLIEIPAPSTPNLTEKQLKNHLALQTQLALLQHQQERQVS